MTFEGFVDKGHGTLSPEEVFKTMGYLKTLDIKFFLPLTGRIF